MIEKKAYSTDVLHPSHACTVLRKYLESLKSVGVVMHHGVDVLNVPPILLCDDSFEQNEFTIVHGHHRAYAAATRGVYIEGIVIEAEEDCHNLPKKEYGEWSAEDISYAFRHTPIWRKNARTNCDSVLSMRVVD